MNFLRKLFNISTESSNEKLIKKQPVNLSLDDSFVHHFINNGGKFLYSTKIDEVIYNLKHIIAENKWEEISCNDIDLLKLTKDIPVTIHEKLNNTNPIFTSCEHLIANSGEILFSSNQLGSQKLSQLSDDFIVYATTSQLVKNIGEGLTGIKMNFKGNIPTNISSIKNYSISNSEDDILEFNRNSKNLYLLLFEDL
ncbi:LUD domain-containing protein [uncultured Tenacibaculum sp.]|uniref:LUD domain-containing protein n=1 Tax=uncultured Tenacibaculum sp. TaxID=174713 RepID=UPI002638AC1C|nr:LUD domain-containing protein [uncultured Tenacibaculum sp.]